MATDSGYFEYVKEQLSSLSGVSYRRMMGEYIIYYKDRIVGGIYDDRLLVKPTRSVCALMPNAPLELPYEGAKEMLLVENIENRDFLKKLFDILAEELPPKKK